MEPLLPLLNDPGYGSHYNCKCKPEEISVQRLSLQFVLTYFFT